MCCSRTGRSCCSAESELAAQGGEPRNRPGTASAVVNFRGSPMTHDAWPSPDAPPGPLPRLEDLPIAELGYDQEAVRAAFDSFYRHAAQLDASLRALEAIELFRRDADALRNDLRALRSLGIGGAA